LHAAHESRDARLCAVATICPVLHLLETNQAVDHKSRTFYRRYTLSGLRAVYRPLDRRQRAPTPFCEVQKADTFRAYDALTVVPRYGFASVDDYYTRTCASRVVGHITRPTLVLSARHDPILPADIAERLAPAFSPAITFKMSERGGHLLFPRDLDLGERGGVGIEAQVYSWLSRQRD
jgi:predicted alpha/beta-fold hydrolase